MIFANKEIKKSIGNIENKSYFLPDGLSRILEEGFFVLDECFFLKRLYFLERNVSRSDFEDCSGYECFVNHIHLDDYVDHDFLFFSLSFVRDLFLTWHAFDSDRIIRAIISCDDFGAVVRFHLLRDGEVWLSNDLDSAIQPVLYIDSNHSIDEIMRL